MRFKLEFTCDNAAFGEDDNFMLCEEASRIIRDVAKKVMQGMESGLAVDINGNRVGTFHFEQEGDE